MKTAQTKVFFRVVFILTAICFLVSLALSGTEAYGSFSRVFSFALGIICFLTATSHRKTMDAERIPADAACLYAVSFAASLAYVMVLFFHFGRYFVRCF